MKPREFTKMTGAGNDFIVVHGSGSAADPDWIRKVCERRRSVGSDGILFVEAAGGTESLPTIRVLFFNPDGSRAFCGNGSRCAARFAVLEGLAQKEMVLETDTGSVPATVAESGEVRLLLPVPVDRGEVRLDPPVAESVPTSWHWIDAGVPHALHRVEDVDGVPLDRWAPPVRHHPVWGPPGINVNIVSVRGPGRISLRTYERGVEGETLACGSAAVAAAWWLRDLAVNGSIEILPTGGTPLRVGVVDGSDGDSTGGSGADRKVTLAGDALRIYRGQLDVS